MSHSFHDGSLDDDDPYLTAITREPSSDRPSIRSTSACPFCHGNRIEVRHTARKAGGVIGTLAGAGGAFTAVLPGAETGATAGMIAGPVGAHVVVLPVRFLLRLPGVQRVAWQGLPWARWSTGRFSTATSAWTVARPSIRIADARP